MIRDGASTSAEIVAPHIAQAPWVNPYLNAIVQQRYDEAMREAEAADAHLAQVSPEGGPLIRVRFSATCA